MAIVLKDWEYFGGMQSLNITVSKNEKDVYQGKAIQPTDYSPSSNSELRTAPSQSDVKGFLDWLRQKFDQTTTIASSTTHQSLKKSVADESGTALTPPEKMEDEYDDAYIFEPTKTSNRTRMSRERFAIEKSYSVENGYQGQRRNIVDDAKFETKLKIEDKKNLVEIIRGETQDLADEELNEDDVLALESIAEARRNNEEFLRISFTIALKENLMSVIQIIKIIEMNGGDILHLESQGGSKSDTGRATWAVFIQVDIKHTNTIAFLKALRRSTSVYSVQLISSQSPLTCLPWFPRHMSDLNLCNHLITKYEPELDMDHPGWKDQDYRARRRFIADISFNFKSGDKIPRIEYNTNEVETWKLVYNKVYELLPGRACSRHQFALERMKTECGVSADNIPQMEDVSNFLKKSSGFTLRPAAGLVTARDFLASLAFRVFQCTQYVRHHSSPHYSPEPDCIHELMGHAPMFADPLFAQFSQEIGLASLGASDEEIEKLATLYWFTVEFGLCKEKGELRAYGAGLLSSYGELLHALSGQPECRPFDPLSASLQPYDDQAYQDIYYVAESFEDMMEKFRKWVRISMSRPFETRYNPFSQTIETIDSIKSMENVVQQVSNDLNHLNNAIRHMKKFGSSSQTRMTISQNKNISSHDQEAKNCDSKKNDDQK